MRRFICIAVLAVLTSGCQTVDDFVGQGPITLSTALQKHFNEKYLSGPGPAYYVIPADGSTAYWSYCASGAGTCQFDVVALDSLAKCERDTGKKCYVFAEGDQIVWNGPVKFLSGSNAAQAWEESVSRTITYGKKPQSLHSVPVGELKNQRLCNHAIKYEIVDHRVLPIWDVAREAYVTEAKGRGLTPGACSIEVSTDTRLSGRLKNLSSAKVCGVAPSGAQWKTSDYARDYVLEARSRGLTLLDCGKAVGLIDKAKLAEASDRLVCAAALHKHPTAMAFSTRQSKRDIIAEAKVRNLTPERCRSLLG